MDLLIENIFEIVDNYYDEQAAKKPDKILEAYILKISVSSIVFAR